MKTVWNVDNHYCLGKMSYMIYCYRDVFYVTSDHMPFEDTGRIYYKKEFYKRADAYAFAQELNDKFAVLMDSAWNKPVKDYGPVSLEDLRQSGMLRTINKVLEELDIALVVDKDENGKQTLIPFRLKSQIGKD